ncbi:adenosine monophosphate-protein transferase SoFic [mine drainage metagenome]|uniref:Adenosine monophosphate-protein transferase SoFic n=1 Tax=mine drainage metagenome TaxID=410659 RepID=A0A1J5SHR1_9ZZZZ
MHGGAANLCYIRRMNSGNYTKYIWQRPEWPEWQFASGHLSELLSKVTLERGRLLGSMQTLGFKLAEEATLRALTDDVIKSSEIEGEKLNPESVRSSLARRLGMDIGALAPADRHVDGVVEMVLDATQRHDKPLTKHRLFGWHAALFPTGYSGLTKITVGAYRKDAEGPMQVVSGGVGREKVHFEAPPAERLEQEMARFIDWFNHAQGIDPTIKAGLAHLWFVTIHPFEDGNGRIGRAVCDMALARADGSSQRFYSLSAQIQRERKDYYDALEFAQKSTLDVTQWLDWFLVCLLGAIQRAGEQTQGVMFKANFWNRWSGVSMNDRQVKMLNKMLDGFDGNLTNKKWASMNDCSPDTALRDIKELVDRGVLVNAGAGGRSTHYVLSNVEQ